ncbi:glutaredoxin family protein [Peribacillus muralis]|uniref:glutaredoxin family protein n=1 Tax=Peribacillus muralis TaxID=264697 RepID=UPI003D058463
MEVIVYSQANCGYCTKLRTFLMENLFEFKELDIQKSKEVYEDFRQLGGHATPFIIKKVDGEIVSKIVGFDQEKILKELN